MKPTETAKTKLMSYVNDPQFQTWSEIVASAVQQGIDIELIASRELLFAGEYEKFNDK